MTYTPTTSNIRDNYATAVCLQECTSSECPVKAGFDRWYAEAIRKAKAEAWVEGITASGINLDWQLHLLDHNPYKEQQ